VNQNFINTYDALKFHLKFNISYNFKIVIEFSLEFMVIMNKNAILSQYDIILLYRKYMYFVKN